MSMATMQATTELPLEEDFSPKHSISKEEKDFDQIIGELENILMGFQQLISTEPLFNEMQHGFFQKHCDKFDRNEENRLEYTQVYNDLN
jgi:hypothetical protein